jgi:glutamate-1-semialdehyde 2,1-aminomutase
MTTIAIIQARMGSSRLPGKVMKEICGKPMIEILLERLSLSKKLDEIVLAVSDQPENKLLVDYVSRLGFKVFQGSEENVLERYFKAALALKPNNVVRITADCPLIDPFLVDLIIEDFQKKNVDYLSNIYPRSFPKGLDTEIFSFQALKKAFNETSSPHNCEHVTPYIRESGKFKVGNYSYEKDWSRLRWTVDWLEDFQLIKKIFEFFTPNLIFSWQDVMIMREVNPDIFRINEHYIDSK